MSDNLVRLAQRLAAHSELIVTPPLLEQLGRV